MSTNNLPVGQTEFERLVDLMAKLRSPETGCPWDLEQDFKTIAPYTIEEAYEVLDAIESGDFNELRDELGDLLLQVVFHSQMAQEAGHFDIHAVARSINDKMIRRHPHVFGNAATRSSEAQKGAWEAEKAKERAEKQSGNAVQSALSGVASALPALMRAEKLQKRAARTGFDWTNPEDIFAKLAEETEEVKEAMQGDDQAHLEEEIGDMLFVMANIARRLNVDPEVALRRANAKFTKRFHAMEALAEAENMAFTALDLEAQEQLWQRVKQHEKAES